jgi:acyl-coenzyme A thioesterase PaaI-like protein
VIATALDEAMSLLVHQRGQLALTARLELDLLAPAPVGAYVLLSADVDRVDGRRIEAWAAAEDEAGKALGKARGTFVEVKSGGV